MIKIYPQTRKQSRESADATKICLGFKSYGMVYSFRFAIGDNLTEGHWPVIGGLEAVAVIWSRWILCTWRKLSSVRATSTLALLAGYVSTDSCSGERREDAG